jgi:hypothetical protein
MAMALVFVPAIPDPVEHEARRIERAAQGTAVDAIDEADAEPRLLLGRIQSAKLGDQLVTQLVVGIQRQHPLGPDMRQSEVALFGETVERPMTNFHAGVPA